MKINHETSKTKVLFLLKHELQTYGQNNVYTRCACAIFTENFSCLSFIIAKKFAFSPKALETDRGRQSEL